MTPDEAEDFYEDDEDPGEIFAWFDAGPHGITARPAATQQPISTEVMTAVAAAGLYGRWRQELLPEVSASVPYMQGAQQA